MLFLLGCAGQPSMHVHSATFGEKKYKEHMTKIAMGIMHKFDGIPECELEKVKVNVVCSKGERERCVAKACATKEICTKAEHCATKACATKEIYTKKWHYTVNHEFIGKAGNNDCNLLEAVFVEVNLGDKSASCCLRWPRMYLNSDAVLGRWGDITMRDLDKTKAETECLQAAIAVGFYAGHHTEDVERGMVDACRPEEFDTKRTNLLSRSSLLTPVTICKSFLLTPAPTCRGPRLAAQTRSSTGSTPNNSLTRMVDLRHKSWRGSRMSTPTF